MTTDHETDHGRAARDANPRRQPVPWLLRLLPPGSFKRHALFALGYLTAVYDMTVGRMLYRLGMRLRRGAGEQQEAQRRADWRRRTRRGGRR